MPSKPKNGKTGVPIRDRFQTPPFAVDLLYEHEFLPGQGPTVLEPAAGEGILANALIAKGCTVITSDIMWGVDFFDDSMFPIEYDYDIHITNPPYSLKYGWLKRCYEIGKPFALLMPSDTMFAKTAQELFSKHGIDIILPNRRINFKTPVKKSWGLSAQFHSSWFVWYPLVTYKGINILQVDYPPYTQEELLERIEREKLC